MPKFIRRKVNIEFTEEELKILQSAQEILMEIEGQDEDVIESANVMFDTYRDNVPTRNPLIIAIDYLGAMIYDRKV